SPTPSGLAFIASTNQSLSAQWNPTIPAGDTYILRVSTSQADFFNPSSSATVNTNATIGSLSVNTTYYGDVASVINGSTSTYSGSVTTATLANVPGAVSSTWTYVGITSVTVTWANGGNPSAVTQYVVQLSTVSGFTSGTTMSATTYALNSGFAGLSPATT